MRTQYNYNTNTLVVFCAGCMATLMLHGSPGMEVDDCIASHQWDPDPEGPLCPKCSTLATQQASFKGIL